MKTSLLSAGLLLFVSIQTFAYVGTDLNSGKEMQFPSKDAKATVVVFLSAKCPCSSSHEGPLKALKEKYQNQGIEFIGVHSNQNEDLSVSRAHFQPFKEVFPIIEDTGAKLANEFKALKTPHAFIIQKGKVVYEGGVDDSSDSAHAEKFYLARALQELSEGKSITEPKTRALGCVIKR